MLSFRGPVDHISLWRHRFSQGQPLELRSTMERTEKEGRLTGTIGNGLGG